jgi:hypothetical protein
MKQKLQNMGTDKLCKREDLAIKLTTPAICLWTIDDDIFYVRCDFVTWWNATFKYCTDIHLKYTIE